MKVKVRVRVKVKNGSRVGREDVLTQRRRGAEYAERFEPRNTRKEERWNRRGECEVVEKGDSLGFAARPGLSCSKKYSII